MGYSKAASTSFAMCHTFAAIAFLTNVCVGAVHPISWQVSFNAATVVLWGS